MRFAALTLLGALALGLAGCGPSTAIPTFPPEPSGTPLFESEEEALAAAEAAYAAYLATSDLIAQEGGVDPERIAAVATGKLYESALESFEVFRDNGWRAVGTTRLEGSVLQFADISGTGVEVVVAYVCVDVSGVDVITAEGASVVSPERPPAQVFEVVFDWLEEPGVLIPSSRSVWNRGGVCAS